MIYKPADMSPAAQFMAWAEGYYGKYPEGQRADILEYLIPWNESYLVALKTCLKLSYSSQYGKPPDIAVFNSLYSAVLAEKEKTAPALPAPPSGSSEIDQAKIRRLRDDMKAAGVTFDTPHWFARTFKFRQDRGDFRQYKAKHSGGAVHDARGIVEPFTTGLPEFGERTPHPERAETTWEDLGGRR